MKEEERQKKQAEFKEKTQAILDQQQAEIAAKMRELEEAEVERKRVLEQQRLQQLAEAEEKRKVCRLDRAHSCIMSWPRVRASLFPCRHDSVSLVVALVVCGCTVCLFGLSTIPLPLVSGRLSFFFGRSSLRGLRKRVWRQSASSRRRRTRSRGGSAFKRKRNSVDGSSKRRSEPRQSASPFWKPTNGS
jgi:hypothetical protein